LRALDVLASADVLAAEDTRTLRKLMDIHAIPLNDRKIVAYHDHSGPGVRDWLVAAIAEGKSVAYASEAGTPLVADPGFALAIAVQKAELTVTSAPGPSAVMAALAIGGLPTDRFFFYGFLPNTKTARETALADLRSLPATLGFYESPKRIHGMLESLVQILGEDRRVSVCRELTKKFEEVTRGTLAEVTQAYEGRTIKGEIVVLVDRADAALYAEQDVEQALREAMRTMRVKDAATAVAGSFGMARREVYQMALSLEPEA
jgi:16S rRNA (cytidine1402-2'-O)-methyltransferase